MSLPQPRTHSACSLLPADIDGFDSLTELALDLRWSWNHGADKIWRSLDPRLWDLTQNPWVILQTVSREKLEHSLADPVFRRSVDDLLQAKRQAEESTAWFQQIHAESPLTCVAYFSMEFMLSEALPIYSGGLGNVAGDQLKAASDLGVPVAAVGLLYQQGYFRQVIDKDGAQQALYPYTLAKVTQIGSPLYSNPICHRGFEMRFSRSGGRKPEVIKIRCSLLVEALTPHGVFTP